MSDETTTTPATEEKGSIGAAGVIGGATGLAGGLYAGEKFVTEHAIKNLFHGSKKANEGFREAVQKTVAVSENANAIATQTLGIAGLTDATGRDVSQFRFISDPKAKNSYAMAFTADGETHLVKGIKKLPETNVLGQPAQKFATGKTYRSPLDAQQVFKGTESGTKTSAALVKDAEAKLVGDIRKAGGLGFGIKNTGIAGKGAIIGLALAGTAAGAMAANAIFGGKHTDQVKQDRNAEPEVANGR